MADGGSEMLEVGLILREAKSGEETRMVAELEPQPGEFQLRLEGLAPGRYAYRAYGINGVGKPSDPHGVSRNPAMRFRTPPPCRRVEMASGWMRSPWFGTFRDYGNGWIFHTRLGWLFLSEDGSGGIWLWMESEGMALGPTRSLAFPLEGRGERLALPDRGTRRPHLSLRLHPRLDPFGRVGFCLFACINASFTGFN